MIHPITGGEVGGFSIFYYKKKNILGIYIFPLFCLEETPFLYGGKILRVHQIFFYLKKKNDYLEEWKKGATFLNKKKYKTGKLFKEGITGW